jgi:hypothetical protein
MYNHKKENPGQNVFFMFFFLVIDETSLTKIGRRLMARMLTRPSTITPVDFTIPTVLRDISENAIVVIDNRKLEHLVMAVEAAVDGGYVKKFGVILLLDSSVAADNRELLRFNVRMRALWRAGIAVVKPWSVFLPRTQRDNFRICDIDLIAARIEQGMKKLPNMFNQPMARLVGVQRVSMGIPLPNGLDWLKLECHN